MSVELSETVKETNELYKLGKTIEEIARFRNIGIATIVNHLVTLKKEGLADIECLIPEETRRKILELLEDREFAWLSEIKERLDEDVTYEDIKLVLASSGKTLTGKKGEGMRRQDGQTGEMQIDEAQIRSIILECLDKLQVPAGRTLLAKILLGSKEKQVVAGGLMEAINYGALHMYAHYRIVVEIDRLIESGYMEILNAYGFYKRPIVVLTEKGKEALRKSESNGSS